MPINLSLKKKFWTIRLLAFWNDPLAFWNDKDMIEKEKIVFEKYVDDQGSFLTRCSLEDNPEVIIAVMGENLSEDYANPQGFEKKMSVSMPPEVAGVATEVNIWFSERTEDPILAHVIQAFFDSRFPDFAMNENTTMGISGPGKIAVRSG